jgi:hypothetical protein
MSSKVFLELIHFKYIYALVCSRILGKKIIFKAPKLGSMHYPQIKLKDLTICYEFPCRKF